MDQKIQQLMQKYGQKLQENVPLAQFTTLKIGGPAKGFFEAENEQGLEEIIKDCQENQIPFLVIGGGSNLLVSDDGFPGLIIKNNITGINRDENTLTVYSGTILQDLVDYTIQNGLGGMHRMSGIPGTVGGAVYGSAGAYGDNIRDYIEAIKCFDGKGTIVVTKSQYDTGYRDSVFKKRKDLIILEVIFSDLPQADKDQMKVEETEVLEKRKKKYNPELLTPGSFFKNIPEADLSPDQLAKVREKIAAWENDPEYKKRFGDKKVVQFGKIPAGNLIDMLGGKGDRVGNIVIDQYHANTFINTGGGKAKDFWNLAKKWDDKVKDEFGVELEPEVQFVNLPPFLLH